MKRIFLIISFLYSISLFSQSDLLNMLSISDQPEYISYLFKGTKIVNAQSVELPANGVLQFNIQHRFGTLNSGLYNLYGLDFSQVRLSFDYGLKDWFLVGIGRSSSLKIIDANSKIRLRRQVKNGFPVTLVINSVVYLNQWVYSQLEKDDFIFARGDKFT